MSSNNNDDYISRSLGEIKGELRALIRNSVENTDTLRALDKTVAAQGATLSAISEKLDGTTERVGKIEQRLNVVEISNAKHSTAFGAAGGVGIALIIEAIKQYFYK